MITKTASSKLNVNWFLTIQPSADHACYYEHLYNALYTQTLSRSVEMTVITHPNITSVYINTCCGDYGCDDEQICGLEAALVDSH